MIVKVVMMYIIVSNCNTGEILFKYTKQMPEFSISGDKIEDCRKEGVAKANKLTEYYKKEKQVDNVSTNVNCKWEEKEPKAEPA